MIVAIDPGLRGCGVACFFKGELLAARYVASTEETARGPCAWRAMARAVKWAPFPRITEVQTLVLEVPQVYRRALSKGDPADLIEVAGVVGALASLIPADEVIGYFPAKWKGQVPKGIHHSRIAKDLTPAEHKAILFPREALAHNVWDAIGLGLFFVKRRGLRQSSPTPIETRRRAPVLGLFEDEAA